MMKVVISSGRVVIDHPGNCKGLRGKEELTLLLFFMMGYSGWWEWVCEACRGPPVVVAVG